MLHRVQIAERIEVGDAERGRRSHVVAGALAPVGLCRGCWLVNHVSLNNEIGKVDVTNPPEALFLFEHIVDRGDDLGLEVLLALGGDRTSTRLNSSHSCASRMPSTA